MLYLSDRFAVRTPLSETAINMDQIEKKRSYIQTLLMDLMRRRNSCCSLAVAKTKNSIIITVQMSGRVAPQINNRFRKFTTELLQNSLFVAADVSEEFVFLCKDSWQDRPSLAQATAESTALTTSWLQTPCC